jgi:hypothetical protein
VGKKITIVFIILLLTVLFILIFFFQQGRKSLFTDPYKVVTPRACLVVETIDLKSFINSVSAEKGLFGEIAKVEEFSTFSHHLKYFADLINSPSFNDLNIDGPAVMSCYMTHAGKTGLLLSMAVPGETKLRHIKEILRSSGISGADEFDIDDYRVMEIPFKADSKNDTVYLSVLSGLLLCSNDRGIMKEALEQSLQENDVRSLPGFSRVLTASGKNEDKIFVVFDNLSPLISKIFKGKDKKTSGIISKIASVASGDIYINEDGLALSGYTETRDSSGVLYNYKQSEPKELKSYRILPASTALFETRLAGQTGEENTKDNSFAEQGGAALKKLINGEITQAYLPVKGNSTGENILMIYELSNRVEAEKLFTGGNITLGNTLYFQPDDQVKIPVYKASAKGFSEMFIHGSGHDEGDSYFTFLDNYLIAGNSFKTISVLLYDNILNKTLAHSPAYMDFENTLPSRAGFFFYCVPYRIIDYLSDFVSDDIIKGFRNNIASLKKIEAIGYQVASSNDMLYNSLSVRFKEEAMEESKTAWETLLDTTACIKPFFFTNHITGAKEIFIQDLKNNVYLINAAGRILWKVPLNERIQGSTYMIDYYKNGKNQLLFSGKNYLHLLDRNGNYVERYPVKLRSPATNSLALFDYDNNKDYRLFIAGENRKIYLYDKTGNVVRGWKPFITTGIVKSEINYFSVSGKDYIVVSDEKSIYFLDRRGNIRVSLKEPVTRARGSSLRLVPGSEPALVCSAPDGAIQYIYFNGTVKKFSLKEFSVDHSFDFFDVDGDGFGEYIFIDKGSLYLYNHNRSEIFHRDFGTDDLGGPINFIFSATDRKIGIFDTTRSLIYLISGEGETMKGFPLKGASMFSIGKLSNTSGWHLIVGGTDRFLYNYKLETGN